MKNEEQESFGSTTFTWQHGYWHHRDAAGKRLGKPYLRVIVLKAPFLASVTDQHNARTWYIDVRGREIGEVLLARGGKYKDGPGSLLWIGPRNDEENLGPYAAVRPDGTIAGIFDSISREPFEDVRWVKKGSYWRLLTAQGRLKGERGITYASDFTKDGLALVCVRDRYAFVRATGRRAWRQSYEEAYDFYRGRAWVQESSGWLLVDAEGRRVGSGVYDDVHSADRDDALTIVQKGDAWQLVRREDGLLALEGAFDEIKRDPDARREQYVLRRGDVKETFNAVTGERAPYDEKLARAILFRAAGYGSE